MNSIASFFSFLGLNGSSHSGAGDGDGEEEEEEEKEEEKEEEEEEEEEEKVVEDGDTDDGAEEDDDDEADRANGTARSNKLDDVVRTGMLRRSRRSGALLFPCLQASLQPFGRPTNNTKNNNIISKNNKNKNRKNHISKSDKKIADTQGNKVNDDKTSGDMDKTEDSIGCKKSLSTQMRHQLLEESLQTFTEASFSSVSRRLVRTIASSRHFLKHFAFVKRSFLMESGNSMHTFCTILFQAMENRKNWFENNCMVLLLQQAFADNAYNNNNNNIIIINNKSDNNKNNSLKNKINSGSGNRHYHGYFNAPNHYEDDGDLLRRLQISMDGGEGGVIDISNINTMNLLNLKYQVPWPSNIILSDENMSKYEAIFRFIMKIKWAKYALDSLHFLEIRPPRGCSSSRDLIHKLQLFRMKVLNFANSFDFYVMTRILESSGVHLQERLRMCRDMEELIQLHHDYLHLLHNRCLFTDKTSFLNDLITSVLQISLDIYHSWLHFNKNNNNNKENNNIIINNNNNNDDNVNDAVEDEEAEFIKRFEVFSHKEKQFSRCVKFLSSTVNQVIQRGSFPHLESLAFTLSSCVESCQEKLFSHLSN